MVNSWSKRTSLRFSEGMPVKPVFFNAERWTGGGTHQGKRGWQIAAEKEKGTAVRTFDRPSVCGIRRTKKARRGKIARLERVNMADPELPKKEDARVWTHGQDPPRARGGDKKGAFPELEETADVNNQRKKNRSGNP